MTSAAAGRDTRDRIIKAAEELFASQGVAAVSLRQINLRAAQHNTGAVQYHFGNRDGLVRAILDKHEAGIEPRRHALLDQYEAAGEEDMRALAAAYVLPLASKLDDSNGGREFLRISAEYYTRPASLDELIPFKDPASSMFRWHKMLDPLVPVEKQTWLNVRFPALRFTHVELARRAGEPPRSDNRLFTSHVVDLVTSLLTTEPSAQTSRVLEERRRKR